MLSSACPSVCSEPQGLPFLRSGLASGMSAGPFADWHASCIQTCAPQKSLRQRQCASRLARKWKCLAHWLEVMAGGIMLGNSLRRSVSALFVPLERAGLRLP